MTGVLTGVDRDSQQKGTVRSILVEEPPGADCGKGPAGPGCEKIYFRITDETRVLREGGGRRVEVSPGDLAKGQMVRADYTGYPLAESYPAQTTSRTVVILESAESERRFYQCGVVTRLNVGCGAGRGAQGAQEPRPVVSSRIRRASSRSSIGTSTSLGPAERKSGTSKPAARWMSAGMPASLRTPSISSAEVSFGADPTLAQPFRNHPLSLVSSVPPRVR